MSEGGEVTECMPKLCMSAQKTGTVQWLCVDATMDGDGIADAITCIVWARILFVIFVTWAASSHSVRMVVTAFPIVSVCFVVWYMKWDVSGVVVLLALVPLFMRISWELGNRAHVQGALSS